MATKPKTKKGTVRKYKKRTDAEILALVRAFSSLKHGDHNKWLKKKKLSWSQVAYWQRKDCK